MTGAATDTMRIGQLAARVDVSCRTLRYYEELGLLQPSGYTTGGTRCYGAEDVRRVERIRELQDLMAFDLEAIRQIIGAEGALDRLRSEYRESDPPPRRKREIIDAALTINAGLQAQAREKRDRLQAFLDDLADREARCLDAAATLPTVR